MPSINETLKKLRKKNGLTQRELAKLLNLDVSSISKIESGEVDITLKRLEQFARCFKMTAAEVLTYGTTEAVTDRAKAASRLSALQKQITELQQAVTEIGKHIF